MNTSDVLNRAADLIEERGWRRGVEGMYGTDGGGLCILGALGAATAADMVRGRLNLFTGPAARAVFRHLDVAHEDPWTASDRTWRWNDDVGRTAAEVIEVLRAAALIEQAKENASTEVAAERVTVIA